LGVFLLGERHQICQNPFDPETGHIAHPDSPRKAVIPRTLWQNSQLSALGMAEMKVLRRLALDDTVDPRAGLLSAQEANTP